MDIDDIEHKLKMGKLEVQEVEHLLPLGCMVITYRESSGGSIPIPSDLGADAFLKWARTPLPATFYRVVYSSVAMNIQSGVEKITPEFREIIYD